MMTLDPTELVPLDTSRESFALMAQILPVFFLAIVLDRRLNPGPKGPLGDRLMHRFVALVVVFGELMAVLGALADDTGDMPDLSWVMLGVMFAFICALSIMVIAIAPEWRRESQRQKKSS